jgi:hypothetical protein
MAQKTKKEVSIASKNLILHPIPGLHNPFRQKRSKSMHHNAELHFTVHSPPPPPPPPLDFTINLMILISFLFKKAYYVKRLDFFQKIFRKLLLF